MDALRDDQLVKEKIREALSKIVDPGTSLDVTRMGLIRQLDVTDGRVEMVFRPNSPVCPLAFGLAADVYKAVLNVPEVASVHVRVENFDRAHELELLLKDLQQ